MKILLSAIACDPYRGSEAHFGWNALEALASRHDVWVLGHGHDAAAIKRAREEGLIGDNVRFYPHRSMGGRHPNRIVSRIQNWRDYQMWSREVLPTARRLDQEVGFDVAHHVTLSTWRVPSELWRLRCPFVWGPVGGAEVFPLRLLGILSPASVLYELARRAQNLLARRSGALRRCVQQSAHIFASTPETRAALLSLGTQPARVSMLSAAFFTEAQIRKFQEAGSQRVWEPGPLEVRLFAGGDIEGRKGHALALQALARCKRMGIQFHYTIAGQGPEVPHLRKLSSTLGIGQSVFIVPPLQESQYLDALGKTHIYLLPSLRDSAGLTLLEAMLAGCIPVVANAGGPGLAVDEICGVSVACGSAEAMVSSIAGALVDLARNPAKARDKSQAARQRARTSFDQTTYLKQVGRVYELATGCGPLPEKH